MRAMPGGGTDSLANPAGSLLRAELLLALLR